MRVVIYDAEDMEPITVIKLDDRWVQMLKQGREVTMAVTPLLPTSYLEEPLDWERTYQISRCRLRFERIMKGDKLMMWICTTVDGESALLLRSVFLPGQQSAVADERERAFRKGLGAALGLR